METDEQLDFEAFQQTLIPQRIVTWQIMYAVFALALTLFAAIVLMLFFSQPPAAEGADTAFIQILTIVHACVAFVCYAAAYLISRFWAGPKGVSTIQRFAAKLNVPAGSTSREGFYLQAVFTGAIIRTALLEGAAVFGLIVCLLGVTQGIIQKQPAYLANVSSYLVFMVIILWTYPTRRRLENGFKERFRIF